MTTENNAIADAIKISERIANLTGSLAYPHCSGPDYREWDSKEVIYLLPNTQRTIKLDPRFFFKSSQMQINFQVTGWF